MCDQYNKYNTFGLDNCYLIEHIFLKSS